MTHFFVQNKYTQKPIKLKVKQYLHFLSLLYCLFIYILYPPIKMSIKFQPTSYPIIFSRQNMRKNRLVFNDFFQENFQDRVNRITMR